MSPVRFSAAPQTINGWTLVRLPKTVSAKFPSRGMCMGTGTINGVAAVVPLEPDGAGSHWFAVEKKMKAKAGKEIKIELEPMKDGWPEPEIPADIQKGLAAAPAKVREVWHDTTVMARWDWVRSIVSTNSAETRAKRIVVACDKMRKGEKRPCCFNRSACCEPAVSKGGVLMETF